MSDDSASEPRRIHDIDFDAVYRGDGFPGSDFDGVPWDIGEPQPAVVEFERAGLISGNVLDVGCGLGDNAIFLASRGYRVTAVDGAARAIEEARVRVQRRGLEGDVELVVADARELSGYDEHFDTVVDSALFHCFRAEDRPRYAAALHRATRPGAGLNLLCFSEYLARSVPTSDGLSEDEIRASLSGAGWEIAELRRHTIATSVPREFPGGAVPPDVTPAMDATGRLLFPAWAVTANRA